MARICKSAYEGTTFHLNTLTRRRQLRKPITFAHHPHHPPTSHNISCDHCGFDSRRYDHTNRRWICHIRAGWVLTSPYFIYSLKTTIFRLRHARSVQYILLFMSHTSRGIYTIMGESRGVNVLHPFVLGWVVGYLVLDID